MAAKKKAKTEPENSVLSLIDPVYTKFTRSVVRALSSNEFYQFFMDAIEHADNEIQFSNRKEVKTIDPIWVEKIEDALDGFQYILAQPRHEIKDEELIVNIGQARRTGPDVVRHLASHAKLVDEYDDENGEVQPNHVLQKYREENIALYENRLVFTTLEMAQRFVNIRYDAIFAAMNDEYGAKLKLRSDMDSVTEHVHLDMFMHIRNTASLLETDEKNRDIYERISRLHRVLNVFMNSEFARVLAKYDRVRGPIHKTNILRRNPYYKAVVQLLEFLRSYDQIGYVIDVHEQNPVVDEQFQEDLFRNVLFNYLVLKGHLESEKDREVPLASRPKQRSLKPKFIKEIIEEITEDYDLPDLEIRKVLIEELTKEQLMLEEAEERRRLVEEQEQRLKEEAERAEAERLAEEARIEAEREAEEERVRLAEEAERQRIERERVLRDAEEHRRATAFWNDIKLFRSNLADQKQARQDAEEQRKEPEPLDDFAEVVTQMDAEEQRRRQEILEERRLRAEERARRRDEERRALLVRMATEERMRKERERKEAQEREEALQSDLLLLRPYLDESLKFTRGLGLRRELRKKAAEEKSGRKGA